MLACASRPTCPILRAGSCLALPFYIDEKKARRAPGYQTSRLDRDREDRVKDVCLCCRSAVSTDEGPERIGAASRPAASLGRHLHQSTDLDIGGEDDPHVLVEEGRQSLEDRSDKVHGNGRHDHDED